MVVALADELDTVRYVEAGFFAHFAHCGRFVAFTRLDLALGERPVVVLRAMHQQNLDLAVRSGPGDQPTGRRDLAPLRALGAHIHECRPRRTTRCQTPASASADASASARRSPASMPAAY